MTSSTRQRHWRGYDDEPLPTAQEALSEPLRNFPSWFLRIERDRPTPISSSALLLAPRSLQARRSRSGMAS